MKRWFILIYGVVCYLAVITVIAYTVAFFGNAWVPRTIDSAATVPLAQALFVNVALVLMFGLQHSVMARPAFKQAVSRFVPPAIERSNYVLMSSIALAALMVFWQPLGGVIWEVESAAAATTIRGVYFAGWALMIWSTFMMCHLEFFGIRQAWYAFRGKTYEACEFQTPSAYRFIRHPIYASWIVILWASPVMTLAHFVLAAGLTAYVFVGMFLEERDLVATHPDYEQYRRKVPALVPSTRRHLFMRGDTIINQ